LRRSPPLAAGQSDVARLFVEVKAAYGALDVLVNNAAVYKLDPLEKVTEEEFHREFQYERTRPPSDDS
jgi:3-oxoacyl-[acyl-carrier protein] reductase